MNKRQIKKRQKIVTARMKFFNRYIFRCARANGKTMIYNAILKACVGKKYKPFKQLKKMYEEFFILSVDLASGKDYSVKTKYRISNGITTILKSEFIN